MARGRLLSAAIATILVPLPRRVGPTAKPLFWRSRKLHPRTPLPDSACLVRTAAAPAASALVPTCPCESTAGTAGGRSGTKGTSPATRATARPCPAPKTHHSTPTACRATAARDCLPGALLATPVPPIPTVHRSTPSVLPSALAETHRASTECHQIQPSNVYETGSSKDVQKQLRLGVQQISEEIGGVGMSDIGVAT